MGFEEQIRAIVIGGSGGVGQAFVQALSDRIVSTGSSRPRGFHNRHHTQQSSLGCRLTRPTRYSLIAFSEQLKNMDFAPNFVINCTGVLHTDAFGPKKPGAI